MEGELTVQNVLCICGEQLLRALLFWGGCEARGVMVRAAVRPRETPHPVLCWAGAHRGKALTGRLGGQWGFQSW